MEIKYLRLLIKNVPYREEEHDRPGHVIGIDERDGESDDTANIPRKDMLLSHAEHPDRAGRDLGPEEGDEASADGGGVEDVAGPGEGGQT